jgi:hypothetical protein
MQATHPRSRHRRAAAAILIALAVAAAMVAGAPPASACSCMAPAPPETALAEADAVFAGEVTAVEGRASTSHVARVAVTEVFTGDVGEEVEVHTPPDAAACGYAFEVGRDELVYAVLDDAGRLQTNLCDRTAPVAEADEDLAALGEGAAPEAAAPDDGPPGWLVPAAGALVLAAAAIGTAVALRRRTRLEQP